ncbi:MAG: hypothetical protein ACYS9V_09885, partial [Planctomycetota bacterium]
LMLFSYYQFQYFEETEPWKDAFMFIGSESYEPNNIELEYVVTSLRLLPPTPRQQVFAEIARSFGSKALQAYQTNLSEKLLFYPEMTSSFNDAFLLSGRLPVPGSEEILAGFGTVNEKNITVNGKNLEIVGRLNNTVLLFSDSYLFTGSKAATELFDPNDRDVRNAFIFADRNDHLEDANDMKKLSKGFSDAGYTAFVPMIRVKSKAFVLYMVGMTLLLVGGTFAMFNIYYLLSIRFKNKWLRLPLREIRKYRYLFLSLHLVYFGAVLFFSIVAYMLPEMQFALLTGIRAAITSGSGPLAAAGEAYGSGNMLRAAWVTLLINFFLGSLVSITIPSLIIPGIGIIVALFRAVMWGLLLGPTFVRLSAAMLPHSFTLLLEGEAYIVATFFSLLIPVYLFRKSEGPTVLQRYGKALMMNLRGYLIVLALLVIAAIYESVEVITMMMSN